jgi:hypothetical protein
MQGDNGAGRVNDALQKMEYNEEAMPKSQIRPYSRASY